MSFLVKTQTVMSKKRKRHHTHPGELQALSLWVHVLENMSTIKCIVTEKRDFIIPVCSGFLDEIGSVLLLLCMIAFCLVTFLI